MTIQQVLVPDIGTDAEVSVIEILVKPDDTIAKDDSLITLESDKASMEVPSPLAGKIKDIAVKIGDKITQGKLILTIETSAAATQAPVTKAPDVTTVTEAKTNIQDKAETKPASGQEQPTKTQLREVKVPDIGGAKDVSVIEIQVEPGAVIEKEASLVTLESDKASMEIPSPYAGKIKEIKVKVGDKVSEGSVILMIESLEKALEEKKSEEKVTSEVVPAKEELLPTPTKTSGITVPEVSEVTSYAHIHAGPAVRRFARELGVALQQVKGTGRKERILIEDVQVYVKKIMQKPESVFAADSATVIDFSKFGAIETKPLSRIKRLTGINVHRSWVTVPHVTQFDEADITEMEAFRNDHKEEAEKLGFKLTPLVFVMKAVVACLKQLPVFNASLDTSGDNLILKKYFHIGVAVDTPNGLVVPVIRDVDQKSLYLLADELAKISKKAREKGLAPADMQGSCFTISSLGGIGGTAFTPIVNTPDVAILGVSKASIKPIYKDKQFVPRLMLPLSLSYDHRVIDGADGARFTTYLCKILEDVRQLLF